MQFMCSNTVGITTYGLLSSMHPYLIVHLKKAIQQIYLVLNCSSEMIAYVKQTNALSKVRNVRNGSHL